MEELKLTWQSVLRTCKLRSFGKNYLADAYSPSLQLLAVPNGPEVHLYQLSSTTSADQLVTPTGCTLVCDIHTTHTTTSTHSCCHHSTLPTCTSSSYRSNETRGGGGGYGQSSTCCGGGGSGGGRGMDASNNALHVAWGGATGAQSLLAVAWAHALAVYQIRPSSVDFLATKVMEVALDRKPCGLSWHPGAPSPLLAVYDITEVMLVELSRAGKDMGCTRGRLQYHVSHFSPSLPGALECVSWGQRGKTLLVCMEGTLRSYQWPAQGRLEHVELSKLGYTDSKLHKRVRAAAAAGPGLFVATTDTDLAMRSTSSRGGYMRQHQQQAKAPPSAADAALHLIHVRDSEPGDVDSMSLGQMAMPDLLAVGGPAADSRGCLAAVGSHTADTITIHRLSLTPCTGRAIEPLFRIKTSPHTRPKGVAFIGSRLLVLTGARENAVPVSAANWAEFKMSLEMYTLPPSAFHASRVPSPCTTSDAVCSPNDTVRFAFTRASTLNSSSISSRGKSSVLHQTHSTTATAAHTNHATTSTNTSSSATALRESYLLSTPPRAAWSETKAITPRSVSSSATHPKAFSPSRSPSTHSVSCTHDASSTMWNERWKGVCDQGAAHLHRGLHVQGGVCAHAHGEAYAHGDMHRQVGAGLHDSGLGHCSRGGGGAGMSSQSDATWRTGAGKQVAWSSRDIAYNTHSKNISHTTHSKRPVDSRNSPRAHVDAGARAYVEHGLTHGHGGMHTQGTTHPYSGVSHTHSFGSSSGSSTENIRQPTETARVDAFNPAAERVKEPCPPMLGKGKGTPPRVHHLHADARCSPTTPTAAARDMPCTHGVEVARDGQLEMERKSVRQGMGESRMAVHGASTKLEADVLRRSPRPLSHTVGHTRTHTPPRHHEDHSYARETDLSEDLFGRRGDSALRVPSAMSMTWPAASVASTIASPERGTALGVGESGRHTPLHVCRNGRDTPMRVCYSPMSQPPLSCRSSACARSAVDSMGTAECTEWASGAECGQHQLQEHYRLYGDHQEQQQQQHVHSGRSQSSLSGLLSSCGLTAGAAELEVCGGHSEEYAKLSGRHDDELHHLRHDHHQQQQQQRRVHYEEASHELHPQNCAQVSTHTAASPGQHILGEGGDTQQVYAPPPPQQDQFCGHKHHEWMEGHAHHVQYHEDHRWAEHHQSSHDHHHQQQPQTPLPFHSPASMKAHVSAPSTPLYVKYPPPPLPPTPGRVGQLQVSHSTSASAAGDLFPASSSPIRVMPPRASSPPRTSALDPHTTMALRTHVCPVPASTYARADTVTHAHSTDVHTRAVTAHAHSEVTANTSGSDAVLNRILCVVEGLSSSVKHVEEMVQENNQRIEVLEHAVFRSSSRPCSRISHASAL